MFRGKTMYFKENSCSSNASQANNPTTPTTFINQEIRNKTKSELIAPNNMSKITIVMVKYAFSVFLFLISTISFHW